MIWKSDVFSAVLDTSADCWGNRNNPRARERERDEIFSDEDEVTLKRAAVMSSRVPVVC